MKALIISLLLTSTLALAANKNSSASITQAANTSDIYKYEGKYVLAVGSPIKMIEIVIKNGRVTANIPGAGFIALNYKAQNVYTIDNYEATITFVWNGNSVTKAIVNFDGHEVEALRLEE
jgi:aspartokinase